METDRSNVIYLPAFCRAFDSDTEAGRLLKKLYCGNQKPKIVYPSASRCLWCLY